MRVGVVRRGLEHRGERGARVGKATLAQAFEAGVEEALQALHAGSGQSGAHALEHRLPIARHRLPE